MRHKCCGSNEEHYTECPVIEIEDYCLDNTHAVTYTLIEDRAVQTVCSKCKEKILEMEES